MLFFLFIMVPWINGINEYLGIKLKYRKHINVLSSSMIHFFVIQRRACKIVKYKQNHVSSKAIAHSKSEGFMAKYTTSKPFINARYIFLQDQSCFVFILFLWMAEEKSDQGGAIYNAFPTTTTWR